MVSERKHPPRSHMKIKKLGGNLTAWASLVLESSNMKAYIPILQFDSKILDWPYLWLGLPKWSAPKAVHIRSLSTMKMTNIPLITWLHTVTKSSNLIGWKKEHGMLKQSSKLKTTIARSKEWKYQMDHKQLLQNRCKKLCPNSTASYNSKMHLRSREILYKVYKFHSKSLTYHSFVKN